MKCKHCLNGDPTSFKELNFSEIKLVLNELKRMKVFNINFSGGEPLIREDIFNILQEASKQNFGLRLSSNGLLVDNTIFAEPNQIYQVRFPAKDVTVRVKNYQTTNFS